MDTNCTTFELEAAPPQVAVLGIGSCEQHSGHLPLCTDFFFAARIAAEVAKVLEAFELAPLPYSTSLEHRGFAGTVSLRPETLKHLVWDIAAAAGSWGVGYLVLLNAHGGNFILNPTAREWNMDGRKPRLLLVDFFAGLGNIAPNLHAGEVETSLMLYLAPDKVRMDRREDFVPTLGREDLTHLGMKRMSPRGVWGYPSRASADKGERWFREAVDYSATRVRTLIEASEHSPEKSPGDSRSG
jgi:creatinine amidohydrolase